LATCLHLCGARPGRLGRRRHHFIFYGGTNRVTGARSELATSSIIAIRGKALSGKALHPTPPLSNRELFHRDRHVCAYCAREFSSQRLTRDHILPVSQGGRDSWMNVVTACRHCNQTKSGRTPEQARMELVYAPYVPNKAEYLILCNRNILARPDGFPGPSHFIAKPRARGLSLPQWQSPP